MSARFTLYLVVFSAVLLNATGFDGYHFIACVALVFALDREVIA